jgi:FolB domain-containing protein
MGDEIFIDDLEVLACHGIHADERVVRQRFLLSIRVSFDGTLAKISDNIAHTVNYSSLIDAITYAVKNSSFNLIERLSTHVAAIIFANFQQITSLRLSIKKFPNSMAGKSFGGVGFAAIFGRATFAEAERNLREMNFEDLQTQRNYGIENLEDGREK